jgi:hypothetical protein
MLIEIDGKTYRVGKAKELILQLIATMLAGLFIVVSVMVTAGYVRLLVWCARVGWQWNWK